MKRNTIIEVFSALLSILVGWLVLQRIIVIPGSQTIDQAIFPQSAATFAPGTAVIEPHKPQDKVRHVYHLKQGIQSPPNISTLEFRSDNQSLQSADDPFTVATVVDKLRSQHSSKAIAINIPFHWESSSEHGAEALIMSLEEFETAYFTSELVYRAKEKEFPYYLAKIPTENISGSSALLPKVNGEALTPNISPPTNTLAGFHPDTSVAPPKQLLVAWGEHIVPSFSLLQLAMVEGVSLQEITVILGHCIILGDSGPILPIDDMGTYTRTERSEPAPTFSSDSPWLADSTFSSNIFLSGSADDTLRDMQNLETLHAAPRSDFLTSYQRLPMWAEIIVIADIAILLAWFLGFRPLKRHICFLLVIVTFWPVLVILSSMRNMWTPASAVLATALTGWLTSFFFAPIMQRTPEENESTPTA